MTSHAWIDYENEFCLKNEFLAKCKYFEIFLSEFVFYALTILGKLMFLVFFDNWICYIVDINCILSYLLKNSYYLPLSP